MARFDMPSTDCGALGVVVSGAMYFQLGLSYATGRNVPLDRVTAHKWLNLAAREGVKEAAAMRRELAFEMTRDEIAAAQRAAREHLSIH
ncbi:sel1 repeat family protein [Methylopila sp. M107]|uniref:SEL1-like repeat protein n=1 Tax=Methylopila sp. M107 TaxID=1101190 RepID=UPI00036AA4C9|nr:sel1 repeat family protein [Methylopila sp. M107]